MNDLEVSELDNARDYYFMGIEYHHALFERLRAFCHPEIQWIDHVCRNTNSTREAEAAFYALRDTDVRALCYSGLIHTTRVDRIREAANRGFAYAQGYMSLNYDESYAETAAKAGDRRGMCVWATITNDMALMKRSAELQYPLAVLRYARLVYNDNDAKRYKWYYKHKHVPRIEGGIGVDISLALVDGVRTRVGYAIGRYFGSYDKHARSFYRECKRNAAEATRTWILIGTRYLYRDLVLLIARLVCNGKYYIF